MSDEQTEQPESNESGFEVEVGVQFNPPTFTWFNPPAPEPDPDPEE